MRKLLIILLVTLSLFPVIVFGQIGKKKDSKPKHQLKNIHLRKLKKPVKGDLIQSALEAVKDLLKARGVEFQKQKGKETGFKPKAQKAKVDKLGHKHIRLYQYYKGSPVIV